MPEYFHVRISPKQTNVMADFGKMMGDIFTTRQAEWDNDHKNSIKEEDYLGFITGETDNELIYIFKVIGVGTVYERPEHWKSNTPYTNNNGSNAVIHRKVITLTNQHNIPQTYEWRKFRTETGLGKDCQTWMPRGTQRVTDKKKLSEIFKNFET